MSEEEDVDKPTRTIKRTLPSKESKPSDELNNAMKSLQKTLGAAEDIKKRMDALYSIGERSPITQAAKQIADHQETLNAFNHVQKMFNPIPNHTDLYGVSSARRLSEVSENIAKIKNPIDETNRRLANIEDRFNEMYKIATEAAQIANSLNAAAAEFLVKFEDAALSNEKAARRAILVGVIAVLLSATQIIYNELWRAPKEHQQTREVISEFQAEFSKYNQEQNNLFNGYTQNINSSENSTLEVLRKIENHLSDLRTNKNKSSDN